MNILRLSIPGLCLLACAAYAQVPAASPSAAFKDDLEKAGYAFGVNLGGEWKKGEVDLDPDAVARGIKDALSGSHVLLSGSEVRATLIKYGQDLRLRVDQKRKELGEKNKSEGEAFLAKNKDAPGVITLPCGLQYQVIAEGKGESPDSTRFVSLKYRGTLIDGTEFDNSKKYPDRSNVYPMGGVIRGWAEALERMNPGAKWRLFVPSDLAYGSDGGPNIGPNATLIYDLELVSISRERPKPTAEELKYDRDHIDED